MRDIVQQALLPGHQHLQVFRHAIKIMAEISQFIASTTHAWADPNLKIALGGCVKSLA